jgi:hypothetical protein
MHRAPEAWLHLRNRAYKQELLTPVDRPRLSTMIFRKLFFLLPLGIALVAAQASAQLQSAPLPLTHGVTGNESGLPDRLRPSTVLGQRAVQEVLLEVARAPRDAAFVNTRLAAAALKPLPAYTADDLVAGGYLRRDGNLYHIAFALFTQDDVHNLRAVVADEVRSLAADYQAHGDEFRRIFRDFPPEQLPAVAYFVIGCFSLDWDGMDIAHDHHYAILQEDLGRPLVWAEQRGELNLKEIYWGSHNDDSAAMVFTSFGDHYSLPRMALPDLFWLMNSAAQKLDGDAMVKDKLDIIQHRTWVGVLQSAARMMLVLRAGPVSRSQLVAGGGEHPEQVLDLLVELAYVRCAGTHCSAAIPVLTELDGTAVQQARALSRSIIERWLAREYEPLRQRLTGLTPVREGVAYPQVFTQIWHYVFGMTNGELARRGFFADPYASSLKFKGFIPVVWDQKLER